MQSREQVEREAAFIRMSRTKTLHRNNVPQLGASLVQFYKGTVQRTRKFAGIGEVWETLVPPDINEHCCLESYRAGTLSALVDSSPHMYRLKQLLLSGVQQQILDLCRAQGLRKINLRPGRWYQSNDNDDRRITF